MKKTLFDYDLGDNLEVESPDTKETFKMSIKRGIKSRRKWILRLIAIGLVLVLIDTGVHHKNYSWYDWASGLNDDQVSLAATVAARYQLSDAIIQYSTDKDIVRVYRIERHCAKEELRDLGYRGAVPSKDWPELN